MIGATLSVENGLLKRWCHGTVGEGCGHYITTREEIWPQRLNSERFHQPIDLQARIDRSQREVTEWLMHLPHCMRCLCHNNSYLFNAWYELSREDAARVAGIYVDNYPPGLRQPFFYMNGDQLMIIRLETHDIHNDGDGEIDLTTMQAEFHICIRDDEGKASQGTVEPEDRHEDGGYTFETYRFNLGVHKGWEQMLAAFPQPKKNERDR